MPVDAEVNLYGSNAASVSTILSEGPTKTHKTRNLHGNRVKRVKVLELWFDTTMNVRRRRIQSIKWVRTTCLAVDVPLVVALL